MRPKIFISREQPRSQNFVDIVKTVAESITCTSLLDFSMIPSRGLPDRGWLFFYSQTGIDFFLQQHSAEEISARNLKIAVFGPKTGQYFSELGFTIDFVGTGEARSTADTFLQDNKDPFICFVKGSASKDSLKPHLKDQSKVSGIDIYKNIPKMELDLPYSDILVFTSPLNLETYYTHYPISEAQKVVVIGTSTAMSALDAGIDEIHISPQPSLESLAALVVELCDTWSGT